MVNRLVTYGLGVLLVGLVLLMAAASSGALHGLLRPAESGPQVVNAAAMQGDRATVARAITGAGSSVQGVAAADNEEEGDNAGSDNDSDAGDNSADADNSDDADNESDNDSSDNSDADGASTSTAAESDPDIIIENVSPSGTAATTSAPASAATPTPTPGASPTATPSPAESDPDVVIENVSQ